MTDLKQIEKESRMQLREPSFQEELNKCKNGPKVPGLGTRHTKKYVFLVTDFELVWSFGMSLEGDFPEIEVPPNLRLLVTFDMSTEGVLS